MGICATLAQNLAAAEWTALCPKEPAVISCCVPKSQLEGGPICSGKAQQDRAAAVAGLSDSSKSAVA
eukprot:365896-Chlamydomonas_euryale.AAC.10